jgi:hypothetical protein
MQGCFATTVSGPEALAIQLLAACLIARFSPRKFLTFFLCTLGHFPNLGDD